MAYITTDIDKYAGKLGIGEAEKQKLLGTVKRINLFIRQEKMIDQNISMDDIDMEDEIDEDYIGRD